MGRGLKGKTLRIRFRGKSGIKSSLVTEKSLKKARKNFNGSGRSRKILRIGKVSQEEVLKTGEFFPAEELMRELRKEAEKDPSKVII